MFRNSHSRFFPAPQFLATPSFGLDISDESIKFAELVITKNGIELGRHGEKKIPAGIIESGKIVNAKKLEETLSLLRKEQGVKSVRVSLLEEQIYIYRLHLDKQGLEHVRETIELTLEEHIPIPAEDAIFDYEVLHEDAGSIFIEVAAIPKNVIENYLSVFENSEIAVQSFELEAQAIVRSVIKKGDKGTYMIVDFGEKRTGVSIVSGGIVLFTSTLDVGGMMLTNTIAKNFNVSVEEAEEMKKKFGLQRNVGNNELFPVLLNSVSILRDEVAKHFLYWHTHKNEEGQDSPPIQKIILCGGDSNLIGLAEYFSVSMKVPVEMANVWVNILETSKHIPSIDFKHALSLGAALGLALGDFEK